MAFCIRLLQEPKEVVLKAGDTMSEYVYGCDLNLLFILSAALMILFAFIIFRYSNKLCQLEEKVSRGK